MAIRLLKGLIRNAFKWLGYIIISEPHYRALATAASSRLDGSPNPAGAAPVQFAHETAPAHGQSASAPPAPGTGVSSPSVAPGKPAADAELFFQSGKEAQNLGKKDEAVRLYSKAMRLIHRHGQALAEMKILSAQYCAEGRARLGDDRTEAKSCFVRAIECDPTNGDARAQLETLVAAENKRDLTRHCFIFHDPSRAETIHREAVLRSLEYVSIAGVAGDVLEFGVLAGWSARIFCENMRELMNMGDIHLFDSFDGLPEYTSAVDINSYEIGGRNLWANKMRFPDEFVRALGSSIDAHVADRLSDVLNPERIKIHRGFYSESLKQPLGIKAALVHIDCDLYQSTVEVLQRLYETDVFQDGCVLMFDDWNCNKASPNYGERRAFNEFLERQDRYTSTPFFTYGFNGAVFFLHDRNA